VQGYDQAMKALVVTDLLFAKQSSHHDATVVYLGRETP
jgi:hypothetical protein